MDRFVCIHGHFYQPPRENPWLEAIELQDSAYPYHDWNARIDAECYAPNSAARILDGNGRIAGIVNIYSRISFNFGPTLLAWLEAQSPETYRLILEADRESAERFSGHGSALAQPYNHMIMPLANARDKRTQVEWGIRDFEHRFGRRPEGMWLPEAAVDIETLEILAGHGIRFTVLSPYQARRVRQKRRARLDTTGGAIDPARPYRLRLPSRRRIAVFFYDGPVSRAVAFEHLLENGEHLARRIAGIFSDERDGHQLAHIATDGETYGHHHKHGEMALAYALEYIEKNGIARLTNYGEYLEQNPPVCDVQIYENSSWSCAHGIERWRSDCGCNSGGRPDWNQQWRQPLREALDWLRDSVAPFYEEQAGRIFRDPWAARDGYIDVILDRQPDVRDQFLNRHASRTLSDEEKITALKLLELQRHAMLMYTSCGWFFDEISGIETVQVIQYAGRVLQLATELGLADIEAGFLERLECARSNVPEHENGRVIFEKFVRPAEVDLASVGAHFAITSIFDGGPCQGRIFAYSVDCQDRRSQTAGKAKLMTGRVRITSAITGESAVLTFAVGHMGDHTVAGGVRPFAGEARHQETLDRVTSAFRQSDFPELIRVVDDEFGPGTYSLKMLFRDQQRKVLRQILEDRLEDTEAAYRQIYESNVSLTRFLASVGMPAPGSLKVAAEVTLNTDLRRALEQDDLNRFHITALVEEARTAGIQFDAPALGLALRKTMERMAERLAASPGDYALLQRLDEAAALARTMPFEADLWRAQNLYYRMLRDVYPSSVEKAAGDDDAKRWVERFRALGEKLGMRVE